MERKPRARIMKAKALTAPTPEFVSMVKAGANQEPLRVVKMDGADEIAPLFQTQELTMKDAVKKAKAAGHDIAQLVFKGGQFTDRAKVDAWLSEGGFVSGYEVTEKQDKDGVTEYTVASTATKFETGSIRKVKGQVEGLHVFVGKVDGEAVAEKTDEEVAAETAATKGSTITAAKGDADEADAAAATEAAAAEATEATKTEETATADPAVTEAAKGDEIGLDAATVAPTDAEVTAKADAVIAELRTKGMYEVSSLGSVLSTLRWMVNESEYNNLPDAAVTSIKTAAKSLLDALVTAMNDAVGDYAEVFKADTQKAAPAEQPAAETVTKTDETAAAPAAVAPAPASTVDPALADVLKGIQGAIETLASAVKTQGEEIAEVKTKAAEAAEEASQKGQTRKGADVTEQVAAPSETAKKAEREQKFAEQRLRSTLGSYKASNGFGV